MHIARTTDVDFIVRCLNASWDKTSDDGSPPKELFFPPFGDGVIWVRIEDYGVFLLTKQNHITYEVHTVLLPHARGHAVEIGKAALDWAWINTPAMRIITNVPEFNVLALRLAKQVGFVQFGVNDHSFCKDGKVFSQIMLGINMPGQFKENRACQSQQS